MRSFINAVSLWVELASLPWLWSFHPDSVLEGPDSVDRWHGDRWTGVSSPRTFSLQLTEAGKPSCWKRHLTTCCFAWLFHEKVLQLHTASTLRASEADRAFAKYIILTSRGALIQSFCQKWWNCHKTKAQQGQAAHAVRLKGLLTSSMIKTGLRYVVAD